MKQLILGGARSGKSALAQGLAERSGLQVVYIATATAGDAEMAERIRRHQADRPVHWQLVEEPLALAEAIEAAAGPDRCILVDCLTLWLSNLLVAEQSDLESRHASLLETVARVPGHLILVSNETGMGVIPMGELTRRYVDEAGRLHQALAQRCDRVTLTVAGLPHVLKGEPIEF
ncbi:MAG: bifunctional adenosylcobinamide kinase/adenosylcobinamide-phosphate guanylyltransferase [Gammaproteobacteria bacterium]|nr:bifunctional adenosylcobinamide kinase/adenosylcobinamide-phosphate guanylyltransferase [Gammaproteobacteria bacterium]